MPLGHHGAVFVVAQAGVDQNHGCWRAHDDTVKRHDQLVVALIKEPRIVVGAGIFNGVRRGRRNQMLRVAERSFEFNDAIDLKRTIGKDG